MYIYVYTHMHQEHVDTYCAHSTCQAAGVMMNRINADSMGILHFVRTKVSFNYPHQAICYHGC